MLPGRALDIGVVTNDAPRLVAFYQAALGLPAAETLPMPGGSVHKLRCGSSTLKVVEARTHISTVAPPGGIHGATGYRYFTVWVIDIGATLAACEAAGAVVVVPMTELRPDAFIAIVEDPDGNWLELASEQWAPG